LALDLPLKGGMRSAEEEIVTIFDRFRRKPSAAESLSPAPGQRVAIFKQLGMH
jgi:hypothetical protein